MSEGIGKAMASAMKEEPALSPHGRGRHIFQNPNRRAIFTALTESPCLGICALAARTGLSNNAVKWHLNAMKEAGYVVRHGKGRNWVFYPEGLINRDAANLFAVVNSPRQSALFREIAANPGLSQAELARNLGKSRQWIAAALKALEMTGLVSGLADGVHTRHYPTRLLPDMADGFYRNSKEFADYILKRLGQEGGNPPEIVKRGLDRIIVEAGHKSQRFDIEIGVNPYITCLGCQINK